MTMSLCNYQPVGDLYRSKGPSNRATLKKRWAVAIGYVHDLEKHLINVNNCYQTCRRIEKIVSYWCRVFSAGIEQTNLKVS